MVLFIPNMTGSLCYLFYIYRHCNGKVKIDSSEFRIMGSVCTEW